MPPKKTAKPDERALAVVVDNISVVYKVHLSGKPVTSASSRVRSKGNLRLVDALKNVSFVAHEGETIGVIGSNGSGKSTLMKAVSGLTPVDQGRVFARSRPSFLGVGAAMIKELSGEKNVMLGGLALGFTRAEIKAKFKEIVAFAGLEAFIDLPMSTYSSGMVERLKFAIAATKSHDILIIDEALAVGDADFRSRSEARIRELAKDAGCVFLVSHSLKSILSTCERVIWVEQGSIRMDGPAREVCKAYAEFTGAPYQD